MNNTFIEENQTTKPLELFVEKYRPKTLNDYIGSESFKNAIETFIKSNSVSHLLLYGRNPGTGKTSAAKLIVNSINCDYLYLNMSDTNGIETVRNQIKSFASTCGFKDIKVIICDEFDGCTAEGQSALRNIIETFSNTTRFILTCNYVEKIIPPLRSRCQEFEVLPPSKKDVALRLKYILDNEKITYTLEDMKYIVEKYYPDMRKIINFTQQYSSSGKIILPKEGIVENDAKNKIVELLKRRANFNEIRQVVADAEVTHFESYYQELYDNVSIFAQNKESMAVIIIAEYLYQNSLVVDKEITFMACISRLLKDIK